MPHGGLDAHLEPCSEVNQRVVGRGAYAAPEADGQIHTVAIADVYLALAGRPIKVVQYAVGAVERLKTGVREPVRSRQQ